MKETILTKKMLIVEFKIRENLMQLLNDTLIKTKDYKCLDFVKFKAYPIKETEDIDFLN